jgi:hypothetical protein
MRADREGLYQRTAFLGRVLRLLIATVATIADIFRHSGALLKERGGVAAAA